MINKLKTLGLAFVAIAAMSAFVASVAHAGTFDIGANPAVITGHSDPKVGGGFQEHTFTLHTTQGALAFAKCPTASFEGTSHQLIGGQTPPFQEVHQLTLTPTYGPGCTAFGMAAQILMNGCKYTFTGAGQPPNTYLMDLTGCTAGKSMEIKTPICTLDVLEHHGMAHITGQNVFTAGQPHEVTLEMTLRMLVRQTGIACPDGDNHVSTNLTLNGNTVLKAYHDLGSQLIFKHNHQYNQVIEGAPVNLTTT
jgi:hypothetical protein